VWADDPVQASLGRLLAYPNPFNPDVNLAFDLKSGGQVRVDIFNLRGQKVTELLDAKLGGGRHTLHWNGRDDSGRSVASGVYFARVRAAGQTRTLKLLLMK